MLNESAPRIRTDVQVMFFDTDCAAVVHNIAYLRFIEVARTLLAEQLGLRAELAGALRDKAVVAVIGPVCQAALAEHGIVSRIQPDKGTMGALVHAIAEFQM